MIENPFVALLELHCARKQDNVDFKTFKHLRDGKQRLHEALVISIESSQIDLYIVLRISRKRFEICDIHQIFFELPMFYTAVIFLSCTCRKGETFST